VLIPWIVYLALVGFDILLLAFIIATAPLGFLHHRLLTLVAFMTGVLLVCDARFEITTARRGDIVISVLSAAIVELPLATILIGRTLRIVRLGFRIFRGPPRIGRGSDSCVGRPPGGRPSIAVDGQKLPVRCWVAAEGFPVGVAGSGPPR
jgi:hypothetical protein